MNTSKKRKNYVKYGESFIKVRQQARDVLGTLASEAYAEYLHVIEYSSVGKQYRTDFARSEKYYLTSSVIKYLYDTLQNFEVNLLCYDMEFVLTRPSIARKIVEDAVADIIKRGLFTKDFTRLNELVDKFKFEAAREYFHRNYKAYKVETTDYENKLFIHRRDMTVTPEQLEDALNRDKIAYKVNDGEYYIMFPSKYKGARG